MKIDDALLSMFCKFKNKSFLPDEKSDDLGDVDDNEVKSYLNNQREFQYKKIIWEKINKDYLQEQIVKKQSSEVAGDAAVAQKSRKRQRQQTVKTNNPAQADSETSRELLIKKRLNSKINFDVLDNLFSDSPAPGSNIKLGPSSVEENGSTGQSHHKNQLEEDLVDNYSDVMLEEDRDREFEDPTQTYGDDYLNFENEEEYDYNYYNYGDGDEL